MVYSGLDSHGIFSSLEPLAVRGAIPNQMEVHSMEAAGDVLVNIDGKPVRGGLSTGSGLGAGSEGQCLRSTPLFCAGNNVPYSTTGYQCSVNFHSIPQPGL